MAKRKPRLLKAAQRRLSRVRAMQALKELGWAALCVGIALGLRLALFPLLGNTESLTAFFAAIALATLFGGMRAGVFAMVLGYLLEDWLKIPPFDWSGVIPPAFSGVVTLGIYVIVGLAITFLVHRMVSVQRQARVDNERLQTVLKQMPMGVIIAEAPSGRFALFNEQAEKICGRSFSDFQSMDDYRGHTARYLAGGVCEPSNWPLVRSLTKGEVITGEEIEFNHRVDGSRRVISVNSAPVRDKCGDIVSVVMSIEDVTEYKNSLEALQHSEERLHLACTACNLGVWAWEPRTGRVECSPEHQALFGIKDPNFAPNAEAFFELVHPEDRARARETVQGALDQRAMYQSEFRIIRPDDGRTRWILSVGRAQYEADGTPTRMVGVAMDITDRKRVEEQAREQLREQAHVLEKQVGERTQSLEGVCYHLGHDLRAPLRAMQCFSMALAQAYSGALNETGNEFVRRIATSAARMDELLQDLLEYGRVSHIPMPLSWVPLDPLVRNVLTLMAEEVEVKQAIIKLPPHLPKVWGNGPMLKMILIHLLRNALQYVAQGVSPSIEIRADENEREQTFCVKDNGVGIEKNQQWRIFNVFERLYAAQRYPGTGIGLAIVQKGVDRMGGRVWANSEPGSGSCFYVALPKPVGGNPVAEANPRIPAGNFEGMNMEAATQR